MARWLRAAGHDAVHAGEIGLERARDDDIMKRAVLERRTIITADLDYPQLLAAARVIEPSVILFRDGDWSEQQALGRLELVLTALSEAELSTSIVVVEKSRIRRRTLPLG